MFGRAFICEPIREALNSNIAYHSLRFMRIDFEEEYVRHLKGNLIKNMYDKTVIDLDKKILEVIITNIQ